MSEFIILDTQETEWNKKKKKSFLSSLNEKFLESQTINIKQKVLFYRLLSTMVWAGLSLVKAVSILGSQEKNIIMKRMLSRIEESIRSGQNLSETLRSLGKNFSDSEVSIIESGEKSGKLNTSLSQLSLQVERTSSTKKKLKWAMIYPISIIITLIGVMWVVMVKVIPQMTSLFGDKESLPASTQTLIGISDFFISFWWMILFLPIVLFLVIKQWRKSSSGRFQTDNILLHIPIFWGIIKKAILSQFARVFGGMLGNGISVLEALRIIASAVGNEVYFQRIMLLRDDVRKGVRMGESLEWDKLFPDMLIQMIKIGEETARLDTIILKISDFYDEELDNVINNINKIIEPIIIVVLAIMVGGMALAIMEPIFNLGSVAGV